MIHTGQVQGAVEHQNPDFGVYTMAVLDSLSRCPIGGDRDIAQKTIGRTRGKRQYIRHRIGMAEFAIQPAQFTIVCNQAAKAVAYQQAVLEHAGKPLEALPCQPREGGTKHD
ncbi:MAG TPA: hypothetical protein VKV15_13745 [Bryobacteraceae bacterium]|nr:hypothetical protein [Bryobacteraceae bacterium]